MSKFHRITSLNNENINIIVSISPNIWTHGHCEDKAPGPIVVLLAGHERGHTQDDSRVRGMSCPARFEAPKGPHGSPQARGADGDRAEHKGQRYVIAVDAHSWWFECHKLMVLRPSSVNYRLFNVFN